MVHQTCPNKDSSLELFFDSNQILLLCLELKLSQIYHFCTLRAFGHVSIQIPLNFRLQRECYCDRKVYSFSSAHKYYSSMRFDCICFRVGGFHLLGILKMLLMICIPYISRKKSSACCECSPQRLICLEGP